MDAKSILRAYTNKYRSNTLRELDWYRNQPTLHMAIENAALAINECGKKHSHQWRIRREVLEQARIILVAHKLQIEQTTDFDELHNLVDTLLLSVWGIGELYIYDTALRIGAKLGYLPQKVYLHAGTRKGAIALDYKNRNAIEISELPDAFQQLEPFEVEDILCIFKDKLGAAKDLR